MTDCEKEEQIRTAIVHAAPNQLDKILSSCQQMEPEVAEIPEARKGRKIAMTKKKNTTIGILSIAVAAVLVLLIGGYSILNGGGRVDSVILLDVNPSLSISINDKERVLSVAALNEDAKVILGDMDLEGTTLEVAVNALIGSMLQKGYLGDAQNSILVSVENQDASRGAALQQRVSAQIAEALRTDSMDGAVLSQTVAADDASLKALAEQYGISIGKASLIQEVIAQDGTLTFEALAPMTINEIALIASSRDMSKQNVITQTGQASASAYIGGDQALAIACADAGVSVADIYDRDVEFDSERGVMVYEVDFKAGTLEYEYEIDAKTGEILRSHSELDLDDVFDNVFGGGNAGGAGSAGNAGSTGNANAGDADAGNAGGAGTGNAGDAGAGSTGNANAGDPGNTGAGSVGNAGDPGSAGSGNASGYIGEEAALQAALSHAGITDSSTTRDVSSELDNENGKMIYEVEFDVGRTEYEYAIDAVTGEILRSRVKEENGPGTGGTGNAGGASTGNAGGTGNAGDAGNTGNAGDAGAGNAGGAGSAGNAGGASTGNAGSAGNAGGTGSGGAGSTGNAGDPGNAGTGGNNASGYIGEEAALQAALSHAGITDASSLRETKAELDRENGRMIYEVEFKSGNLEYDYEVDASTGEILKAKSEYDD